MCKRKDAVQDPLTNLLFTRYGLHMLNIPRSGIRVGEVMVRGSGKIVGSGDVAGLFESGFELPKPSVGERAIALEDTQSNDLDAKAGLSLLDRLFKAVDFAGGAEVRAEYEARKAKNLRFKFDAPTRDSIDILTVTDRLLAGKPNPNQFGRKDERFYLVTAVLWSKGIQISATAGDGTNIDVETKVTELARASGKLKVTRATGTSLIYRGTDPLGFGVELVELEYDAKANRVDRRGVDKPIPVRAATRLVGDRGVSFIGDEEDDLFITIQP